MNRRSGRCHPRSIPAASIFLLFDILIVLTSSSLGACSMAANTPSFDGHNGGNNPSAKNLASLDALRVGFLGNSILYFNDCPRLLQKMLQTRFSNVHQDSCLRPGATLISLFEKGNGMRKVFGDSPAALRSDGSYDLGASSVLALLRNQNGEDPPGDKMVKDSTNEGNKEQRWHAVVMNDHTQSPTRRESREATIQFLLDNYVGSLKGNDCVVVLLQTAAYRYTNMRGTEDLGSFDEFTTKLEEGYHAYQVALREHLPDVRIAPVGKAFAYLHKSNFGLWERLYSWDHFHFSPLGTWLEACVIYVTLLNEAPPPYDANWWKQSRRMQPTQEEPLPRPKANEAEDLRRLACQLSGISLNYHSEL